MAPCKCPGWPAQQEVSQRHALPQKENTEHKPASHAYNAISGSDNPKGANPTGSQSQCNGELLQSRRAWMDHASRSKDSPAFKQDPTPCSCPMLGLSMAGAYDRTFKASSTWRLGCSWSLKVNNTFPSLSMTMVYSTHASQRLQCHLLLTTQCS